MSRSNSRTDNDPHGAHRVRAVLTWELDGRSGGSELEAKPAQAHLQSAAEACHRGLTLHMHALAPGAPVQEEVHRVIQLMLKYNPNGHKRTRSTQGSRLPGI